MYEERAIVETLDRDTYHHLMSLIEEIRRISESKGVGQRSIVMTAGNLPRIQRRWHKAIILVEDGRSPLPHTPVVSLPAMLGSAGGSPSIKTVITLFFHAGRKTYGTGCQFLNPTLAPPSYPEENLSRKTLNSGSVGMRPPLTLAYAERLS